MADKKITALTALGVGDPDPAVDLLHIIDYSASPVNKKITVANLFSRVDTNISSIGATTFEVAPTTALSGLKVSVANTTPASGALTEVIVNDNQNDFVDFTVKSKQSAKAIHVDSSYVTGSSGPGVVFINGDAANQDFCIKGDDWDASANDPVLFSDASHNAAGLGTAVLDGNYCVQVAAGPNASAAKHSMQLQGNLAFSGVESLNTTTVAGAATTLSAYKTVHKITVNDNTDFTATLPTTGCVDGQLKIVMITVDSGGSTITLNDSTRAGTQAITMADDGDAWIGIYDSGSSKWINLSHNEAG